MAMYASPTSALAFSNFGDLLKFLRRRECLTQLELSIAVGYSEAQISRLEKNQRLPDLTALQALFIPALHLEKEPELAKRFLELAESARVEDTPAPGIAPYKGLQFFDESDAEWFFGREALTAHLVERLKALIGKPAGRLLAVVGASGSGKSSVVRAGLAVALKRDGWNVCVLTPTAQPLAVLATIDGNLLSDISRHPSPVTRHSLVIVDQFEEVFTLCRDEVARAAFIDKLLALGNAPNGQCAVALALRADFYSHCAQFPQLRQAIAAQQEFIGQMSPDELRRAIEEPAQRGGWEFEPGLVDLMLRDVGADSPHDQEPGALPLLSHALLATWEHRRGRTFTFAGYRASGGVRGAIAETAESVFTDQFNRDQQEFARDIFLRLTELGEGTEDTRRRATLTELVPHAEQAAQLRAVLNTLADARLVMLGEDSAEVAHEALIREWQRLRDWLNQDREGLRLHRQLTQTAREWEWLKRDAGALYRGARLAQAVEWSRANVGALNDPERAFLDASVEQEHREEIEREAQRQRELQAAQKLAETQTRAAHQLRWRAIHLTVALILALAMAGIALFFGEQARGSAVTAQTNARNAFARELAANANNNLDVDPERSVLLALQAVKTTYDVDHTVTKEAEEALHRAILESRVELTLLGHQAEVWSVTYSPDGKRIATGSQDKTAKIWDAATGKPLLTLTGHTDSVNGIAYGPDGTRLATTSDDGTAKIWDVATGKELLTLIGHTAPIHRIVFSPDGTRVATSSDDKTARIWDAKTGKQLMTLLNTAGDFDVAFNNDGTRLAVTTFYGKGPLTIWDVSTGRAALTIKESDPFSGYGVAFSPDGTEVAMTDGGFARIRDARTGELKLTLSGHAALVSHIVYSPDGKKIATSGYDHKVKIWDSTTGKEILSWTTGHQKDVDVIAFSPDGKHLATASMDGTARVWDITPRGELLTVPVTSPIYSYVRVHYSPDGTRLLHSVSGEGKVWDATTGQELLSIHCSSCQIGYMALSPDGTRIATANDDNTAKIWDAATGQLLLTLSGHADLIAYITYSADGKRIATASRDGTAKIWDAATGKELQTLRGHESWVQAVAFSPDGTRLITGSKDARAIVWDIASGKEQFILKYAAYMNVYGVTFSPDGTRIATASRDTTAKIWDAATGAEQLTLRGHASSVVTIAFSPDGKRVVTASRDGIAKLWDATTGKELLTLLADEKGANGVEFSPDGTRLATSGDSVMRDYTLRIEDLIPLAQSRVTRTLTLDECQEFLHVDKCP